LVQLLIYNKKKAKWGTSPLASTKIESIYLIIKKEKQAFVRLKSVKTTDLD